MLLTVLALLSLAGAVWAQNSPNYDLSWHVIAGGGRNMASASYALRGTLGQLAVGKAESADHALETGYWSSVLAAAAPYEVFLPLVVRDTTP
jgi:hypothetical protein